MGPGELFVCIPPTVIYTQSPQNAVFVDNSKPECTKFNILKQPFQLFPWGFTVREEKIPHVDVSNLNPGACMQPYHGNFVSGNHHSIQLPTHRQIMSSEIFQNILPF